MIFIVRALNIFLHLDTKLNRQIITSVKSNLALNIHVTFLFLFSIKMGKPGVGIVEHKISLFPNICIIY